MQILRLKSFAAILAISVLGSVASAQQRMYIDDNNEVPLRTGQSIEYRIIHRGLPAGTMVEVLQENSETGYSLVREPGGREGWLPTRYLRPDPIARDRLKAVEQELQRLKEQNANATGERQNLSQENQKLLAENQTLAANARQLQEELQQIKRISENAINLDRRNQELRESTQQLKSEVELLTAENMRLKENADTEKMLIGAGLVGIGVLIAILIPWMKPKKKSSWA